MKLDDLPREEVERLLREDAKMIALAIRNNLEDFHVAHLDDDQMKELNPLIRDAIYTALHAQTLGRGKGGDGFVAYLRTLVPPYWEEPQLLEEYTELLKREKA